MFTHDLCEGGRRRPFCGGTRDVNFSLGLACLFPGSKKKEGHIWGIFAVNNSQKQKPYISSHTLYKYKLDRPVEPRGTKQAAGGKLCVNSLVRSTGWVVGTGQWRSVDSGLRAWGGWQIKIKEEKHAILVSW